MYMHIHMHMHALCPMYPTPHTHTPQSTHVHTYANTFYRWCLHGHSLCLHLSHPRTQPPPPPPRIPTHIFYACSVSSNCDTAFVFIYPTHLPIHTHILFLFIKNMLEHFFYKKALTQTGGVSADCDTAICLHLSRCPEQRPYLCPVRCWHRWNGVLLLLLPSSSSLPPASLFVPVRCWHRCNGVFVCALVCVSE